MNGVADALATVTNSGRRLPVVPWSEWLAKLEAHSLAGGDTSHIVRVPALKLLPFYRQLAASDAALRESKPKSESESESEETTHAELEAAGFVRIATDKMQALSPTLRNLDPMDGDHPKRWIAYWHSRGLFDPHSHSHPHTPNSGSTSAPSVPAAVTSSGPNDVIPIAATTAPNAELGAATANWRNSVVSFISAYISRLLYSFRP